MYREILPLLESDCAAITVNARLTLQLQREYAQFQAKQQRSVWPTATIVPLASWLQQLWQSTQPTKILLTDPQALMLWQQIIQQTTGLTLLQPLATAELAYQAWQSMHTYQLDWHDLQGSPNDEVNQFYQWAMQFQKLCQQKHWLTQTEIVGEFLQNVNQINIPIPKQLLWMGFDEVTPNVNQFCNELSQRTTIKHIYPSQRTSDVKHVEINDPQMEIACMAHWAKAQLKTNPSANIGCIVPDLSQQRTTITRIFTELFSINDLLPSAKLGPKQFNLSAGQHLTEFAIIADALGAISWLSGSVVVTKSTCLWQSPYLNLNNADIECGALLDQSLRNSGELEYRLTQVLSVLAEVQSVFPSSTWLKRWRAFLAISKQCPSRANASTWAQLFINALKALQWPGQRTLNSFEYQVAQRWQQLLQEFTQYDRIENEFTLAQALQTLQHLSQRTEFQTEGSEAPIQILGTLESAGCEFDALWVMGLHQNAWPAAASPNPFIPFALQQQHNLPHANAARELHYAEITLARLCQAAPTVILSSPQQQDDQELLPSQLITGFPQIDISELTLDTSITLAERIFNQRQLSQFTDTQAPPVKTTEKITGGSSIFKLQAACPFRAFATIRLNAIGLAEPEVGLAASERGILLHDALARIWQQIKDHTSLTALDQTELDNIISTTVNAVCADHQSHLDSNTRQSILQLESQRLTSVLREWLQQEKQRPPFKVIAQERDHQVKIGDLKIKLQIDRIDELTDGRQIVIDYKTGLTSPAAWFSQRPREPQLPLYCTYTQADAYHGIAFAQVRSGQMSFKGIVHENASSTIAEFNGVNTIDTYNNEDEINDWQSMQNQWRSVLQQLGADFCSGDAKVDPAAINTCATCNLQPLCRINE